MTVATLQERFKGVQATPITPFTAAYKVDTDGVLDNGRALIADGATGLVVCGSIGELPSMNLDEWIDVVSANVAASEGRVPVIATVGHPDIRVVRQMIQSAANANADGVIVVPPYFYGISQDEVIAFYREVDAVGVPFVVYSHPGTGRPEIGLAALGKIADLPHFVALKEATADGAEFLAKANILSGRAPILAAAESCLFFMLAAGAQGCLTAVSAFAPRFLIEMEQAFARNDLDQARALNARLMSFREIVHSEGGNGRPGYIMVTKAAAELCGLRAGPPRQPLTALSNLQRKKLATVLREQLNVLD